MKRFGAAIWVLGIILLFGCGPQQSRTTPVATESNGQEQFRWLDSGRDSALWNRVQTALAQELEPDDPTKLGPHQAAYKYKYLHKIGLFHEEALVFVRYRLVES